MLTIQHNFNAAQLYPPRSFTDVLLQVEEHASSQDSPSTCCLTCAANLANEPFPFSEPGNAAQIAQSKEGGRSSENNRKYPA
jgi:hypothetical protein